MIKLSSIKQILNINDHVIATSPKLKIFGIFEVIKCNSEAPLLLYFSSFVKYENSIIFLISFIDEDDKYHFSMYQSSSNSTSNFCF